MKVAATFFWLAGLPVKQGVYDYDLKAETFDGNRIPPLNAQ